MTEQATRVVPMPNEHLLAFLRSQDIRAERCSEFTITWKAGTVVKVNVTLHQSERVVSDA